jgi:hypothetical protein
MVRKWNPSQIHATGQAWLDAVFVARGNYNSSEEGASHRAAKATAV